MAAGSEQISLKWIGNAERVCWNCKDPITNLAKQVGEVRNVYPGPKTTLLCMTCHLGRPKTFTSRKRP